MFIVGIGSAHPDLELEDAFLSSLGLAPSHDDQSVLARFGVRTRRASLPLEYIQSSLNRDVLEGRCVATATPTALGVAASRQAIERAGITAEEIGLIIADCATPYQTCPSEAQRIGGALGLKVPAYDIIAGSSALALHIDTLSSWNPDRLPDYVLCISTNTPSQHVSFSDDVIPAHLFGDGASAIIVSPRKPSKMRIVNSLLSRSCFVKPGSIKPSCTINQHVSFEPTSLNSTEEISSLLSETLRSLEPQKTPSKIIGPQLFSGEFSSYEEHLGISKGSFISSTSTLGYALGASSGVALSSVWDSLVSDEVVVVLHAGDGVVGGVVVAT